MVKIQPRHKATQQNAKHKPEKKDIRTDRKSELTKYAEKIVQLLKRKYKVKRVFLIGSLVSGVLHDRSDIDLVVEGLAPELYIKALTEAYDILPPGVELNLIPFEDAFPSIKAKTLKKGKLVYGQ